MRDKKNRIQEEKVASPCVGKCKMGLDSLCGGCKRTIKEIMDWPYLDDKQKQEVLASLAVRSEE